MCKRSCVLLELVAGSEVSARCCELRRDMAGSCGDVNLSMFVLDLAATGSGRPLPVVPSDCGAAVRGAGAALELSMLDNGFDCTRSIDAAVCASTGAPGKASSALVNGALEDDALGDAALEDDALGNEVVEGNVGAGKLSDGGAAGSWRVAPSSDGTVGRAGSVGAVGTLGECLATGAEAGRWLEVALAAGLFVVLLAGSIEGLAVGTVDSVGFTVCFTVGFTGDTEFGALGSWPLTDGATLVGPDTIVAGSVGRGKLELTAGTGETAEAFVEGELAGGVADEGVLRLALSDSFSKLILSRLGTGLRGTYGTSGT